MGVKLTVGAEDGGREAAARAQKLAADFLAETAAIFSEQGNCLAVLVQNRVLVRLLEADDHRPPAAMC